MPTTAQMQIDDRQSAIMRQVLAQQAQAQAAQIAADAQRYGYDTQLKGMDMTSGRALEGTRDTNAANLQGINMQQGGMTERAKMGEEGATTRAGIAIKPQMGMVDLEREKLYGSPEYLKSMIAREALGLGGFSGAAGGSSGPASAPTTGSSPASGWAATVPAYQAPGAAALPAGANVPARGKYDMTGFNSDVAGIAANIAAARGTSNEMGPDELPLAGPYTPGMSVRDVSGNMRTVAFPGVSSSSTPDRAAMAANLKAMMDKEATTAAAPGLAKVMPASAPAGQPVPAKPGFQLTPDARAILGLPPDAATARANALETSLLQAASTTGDPRAIRALEAIDPKYKGMFSPNPALAQELRANEAKAGLPGLSQAIEPELAKLDDFIGSQWGYASSDDAAKIKNGVANIMRTARLTVGEDPKMLEAIAAQIKDRLLTTARNTGNIGAWRNDKLIAMVDDALNKAQ